MMGLGGLNSIALIHDKSQGRGCFVVVVVIVVILCDLYTMFSIGYFGLGLQSGILVKKSHE